MSRPYAWRVLGILPILKASACTNTDKSWQMQRRLDLYHRAMDPVIAEINELCKTARYYRWADKMVRLGLAFWHIISMDGLEIAATALSSTMECPTCECPKDELSRTDKLYPTRSTEHVRAGVNKARKELLNRDGSIKERCIGKVEDAEKALKMKIRPSNAFLACYKFPFLAAMPREELHQFLIGLYGEYIIPSAFHSITSVLRKPEFILSTSDRGVNKYLVSNAMLEDVWVRLRDRLSSLDSSTSLVEVTSEYAAHFYDMYVEGHTGKHLTGDRIRILLLNLPFLFRDLIAPEVLFPSTFRQSCLYLV